MEIKHFENKQLKEEMFYAVHDSGLRVYVFPKKGFSKYYAIYGTEYGSIDPVSYTHLTLPTNSRV